MKKHKIALLGGATETVRVPAATLRDTLSLLLEGAQRAARLLVEGESVRRGSRPSWLDAVCSLTVTGLTKGSAVLEIDAPSMTEAAPDRFPAEEQQLLFGEPTASLDVHQSALDLFCDIVGSAIAGDRDHLLADRALLDTCVRLAEVGGPFFDGLRFDNAGTRDKPVIIRPEHQGRIQQLRDETPPPRSVRVSGMLDTISASRSNIVLRLSSGETVRARMEAHDPESLRQYFNTRVVVSGMARFRPSGALIFVDVEHLAAASDEDSLWEAKPLPGPRESYSVVTLQAQDESTGVSAIFGTWPGDESDRDLLAAVAEIE